MGPDRGAGNRFHANDRIRRERQRPGRHVHGLPGSDCGRNALLGDRQDMHSITTPSFWSEGGRRVSERRIARCIRQRSGGRVVAPRRPQHRHADNSMEDLANTKRERASRIRARADCMQVKIEKKFEVKEPVEKVWSLLSDPTKVVASVPGAKITEKVDDRNYKGSISVKVGPAVTDYKGEVHILNMDSDAYQMEIEGKGQDVRGKGSASMKMSGELKALPDGSTEVITSSEVSVVGLLAQFGGRMINDVSNKIFEEFTRSFRAQLAEASATTTPPDAPQGQTPGAREPGGGPAMMAAPAQREPEPIKALPLIFSALRDAFLRLIRR